MSNTSLSLCISAEVFRSLPGEIQEILITHLRGGAVGLTTQPAPLEVSSASDDALEDILTDLSPAQFKKLVDGCGPKTKAALKAMVAGPTSAFRVAAVAKAVGCNPTELSGVWGGITKRLRSVTGDSKAYLWKWGELENDPEDRYIDQDGAMSETTYRSGRRVFGL